MNIVQFRFQTFECAAAVISKVIASAPARIATATSYAIREDEIDAARLPCSRVRCRDEGDDIQKASEQGWKEQHLERNADVDCLVSSTDVVVMFSQRV